MNLPLSQVTSGLKLTKRSIEIETNNIDNSQVVGNTRKQLALETTVFGGSVGGTRALGVLRAEDPMISDSLRKSVTDVAKTDLVRSYLENLQTYFGVPGGLNNSGGANLSLAVTSLLGQADTLAKQPGDVSIRQNFVSEAAKLADKISGLADKVVNLNFQADSDLSQAITSANAIISELYDLNSEINSLGDNAVGLFDKRDTLLRQLAEYFDVRVRLSTNGAALVSSTNGAVNILDSETYAQFNYNNLLSPQSIIDKQDINPVTINYYNDKGKKSATFEVIGGTGSNMAPKISGGKFAALIELRDQILPGSMSTVEALAVAVADAVNSIHNKGSTYPPKTSLTATRETTLATNTAWTGKTTIAIVDENGNPVDATSGKFKPVELDFDKIQSFYGQGNPSVGDIITEINELLNYGPSSPRLALGEIKDSTNTQIPGEFLLNDIKMVGTSDIDANNNFSFELEFDGNQYFGSTIEILAISENAVPLANLPDSFNLNVGEHTRTGKPIDMTLSAGAGQKNISITFRVIGENGVVQEGTADFTVDANNPDMLNKRVAGTPQAGAAGGDLQAPGVTHAAFARAKFVDDDGNEITDLHTKGHIVIETTSDQYRIVIDDNTSSEQGLPATAFRDAIPATGKGFSHYFGMNDFFVQGFDKSQALAMKVRDDIDANPLNMAIGALSRTKDVVETLTVGDQQSSATLQFNAQPANGDTITINGITFTYGAGPGDINLGANLQNTLQNTIAALNANSNLASVMDFQLNGPGDTITITAKNAGTSGNNFTVAGAFGAAIASIDQGNTFVMNPNTNLAGGTDKQEQRVIPASTLAIGDLSSQLVEEIARLKDKNLNLSANGIVPETSSTLQRYASTITSIFAQQVKDADTNYKVQQQVYTEFDKQLKSKTEVNLDQAYGELLKLQELFSYQALTLRAFREITKVLLDNI